MTKVIFTANLSPSCTTSKWIFCRYVFQVLEHNRTKVQGFGCPKGKIYRLVFLFYSFSLSVLCIPCILFFSLLEESETHRRWKNKTEQDCAYAYVECTSFFLKICFTEFFRRHSVVLQSKKPSSSPAVRRILPKIIWAKPSPWTSLRVFCSLLI